MAKIKLKTDGLEGDNLKFVESLNQRFAELPESLTKDEMSLEVRSLLKGLVGEDGKLKIDGEELAKLLGEGDSGIRSILKKQGQEIAALKEGKSKPETFKDMLNKRMDDVEGVFKNRAGHVEIELRAAAVMTTANTVDYSDLPTDLIDSFSLGSFVEKRQPREYVFDMASVSNVAQVEKYKVWEEEGDEQGAFAVVEEGALKPLVSMALVMNKSTARKIAGKYVVTEEFTKFRKNAYAIIQRLVRQKMLRDYAAVLTTDLLADAAPYVSSALDGQFPTSTLTDYHAIAAVAAQIEALDFMPDLLIMNPQDKWRIGMSQDTQGQFYLTIPITDPSGQTRMMGFTLRTSNRITAGNFILGESGLWEIEQEAIKVKMGHGLTITGGTDNGGGNVTNVVSDFDNNRFRVIVETYFHNYIATNNEGSFVYANFETVKALLEAPEAP